MSTTAVVTGASRGIGRAIAARFASDGWTVWALARDGAALDALAAAHPGRVHPLVFDASDLPQVEAVAARLQHEVKPRVLVNNAGVATSASLRKTDTAMLQRTLSINTVTPFILCRALMPQMADLGGGRVVNIASTAGLKGFRYTSAYCASKHALVGLTRALALEFAQKAVTINAVCPGWTDTDMLSQSVEAIVQSTGRSRDDARAALQQLNPMGRFTTPEEVAELVWFLATSPAAATMTGSTYLMDAGETA